VKKIYALMAVGAFLLCLGVLVRVYAYPRLAVVPEDLDTTVVAINAEDEPATFFNIAELSEQESALKSTTVARIDAEASADASSEVGRDVQVVVLHTCTDLATVVCQEQRYPISAAIRTFAIDAATGEAVQWSGSSVETGGETVTDIPIEGYTIKLPFHVEKQTYPIWNSDLGRTVDATFAGEDELEGLRVYRFETEVLPTVVDELDLPGFLVDSEAPTVIAEQVASSTSTLYVEPETGVILSAVSSQDGYAQVDGERVLTTVRGTFVADDETVATAVEEYKTLSSLLYLVRVVVPLAATTTGLLLIGAGVLLTLRHRRRTVEVGPQSAHRALVSA